MNRQTGKPISGWDAVAQSIWDLLTTPKASRVMRRALGSDIRRLVDGPISPTTLVDFYAAAASAIDENEPRYKVTQFGTVSADANGHLTMELQGIYYPRGLLGDFSVSEPANAVVLI